MAEGERATGTPNTIYNLSSVLFHALEGGASYDTYIEDAEREGDEELTDFFRQMREEDRDRAAEARLLIAERTATAGRMEEPAPSISPRPESSSDLPGTEPIVEEMPPTRTGEVPPPPEEIPPERAGEIPTAEEVPPPRTEEVPIVEEVSSGTPPQAPPGDVQRGISPEPPPEAEVAPPPEEQRRAREQEDRGLVDEVLDRADKALGRGEQGTEQTGREDRR